jgi:hypothetical protein
MGGIVRKIWIRGSNRCSAFLDQPIVIPKGIPIALARINPPPTLFRDSKECKSKSPPNFSTCFPPGRSSMRERKTWVGEGRSGVTSNLAAISQRMRKIRGDDNLSNLSILINLPKRICIDIF